MRKLAVLFIAVLAVFAFSTHISGSDENMPPADGIKFWTHITETDPYLGWGYWPGYYGIYPGKSPHGAFLKVYANGIALKAAREGKPMPYGAILVKENYGKDKTTLMAVTPMYKIKGFDPEAGDWFWAKYDANGKVLKAGQVTGCISCHQARKEADWIFTEVQ
jgi:hypothetical protein